MFLIAEVDVLREAFGQSKRLLVRQLLVPSKLHLVDLLLGLNVELLLFVIPVAELPSLI